MDIEKAKFTPTIVSKQFTSFFAFPVIGIGLIVLIGWYSNLTFLTRLSINEVPMAPSTAYVFICLAVGLWFYLRPQKIAINRNAAIASSIIVICLSCLLVITNIFKNYANWEHVFITIPETQLSMPLGHMSLVTALLFIISGFALLFLQSNRKIVKAFSIILTLIIFIISFILLLGYVFDAPFFYFDNFIPPAVLTVLSFFFVSLALVAASDKNTFFVKTIWAKSTSAKLLRIFLPATIAISVIESLIILRILPLLNINPAIGVSIVTLTVVAVVVVVILILSKSMGKSLDTALKNLSESEERFRMISENAPVLINSFDADGRCLFWNKQCNKTFGWSMEEINEHEVAMALFYPDPAVYEEVIRTVISDPEGSFREWHPVTKDGKILSIMWANFSLPNGQVFSMGYDITENKQAEKALQKSEEKARNLITKMMNAFALHELIYDDEGEAFDYKFLEVNPAWENIVGIKSEMVIGKTLREIMPGIEDLWIDRYSRIVETGIPEEFEDYSAATGKYFYCYAYCPEPGKFAVFFTDTTKKKEADVALKQSEAQLRIITDNLPILISQIDKNLKYTFANKYYYDITKYKDKIIGKSVVDIIGEETFKRAYPQMQKTLSGELVSFENRHVDKNNKLLIIDTSYIPFVVNGQVESFFVLAMDITKRKLAEEALRESEEKLNALFTSLTEIVVIHELVLNDAGEAINYRIIDCNKVFTEFTGISKEDAIGKLATEVYQTDTPPYLEVYAKVGLSGDSHEFNTFYPPLNKHLMISVVSPQVGKFATITTDITPMMQIQEMISAKNKEMENYLYVASHDLRTPLVNIQGFSQRFKTQADSIKKLVTNKKLEPELLHQLANITDENIPKTLNFIHSNIEKMDILINGLLQLSRTGKVVMNIQKVDMNALFEKILQRLDFQIKETQCEIHIKTLPECYGDAALLDQLFANIISNALKYYDVERALKITVEANNNNNNKVVYTIKDTGNGISQRHLDKIWDVFYRIDPKSDKGGDGLGLSLVKRIAEKHKGKVWVESAENKGSIFHVELNNRSFTQS